MWQHLLAVCFGVALGLWILAEDDLDSLKGQRVLVTGASGGIGEQLAYQYAKHGATVVVTARRQQQLEKVVEGCQSLSPGNVSHKAIVSDMKDSVSIQNLIKNAVSHMGGLDVLVLNHITKSDIAAFDGKARSLDNVYNTMDINFRSYVQTTAQALPHLTESSGGIVVVNSIMGHVPGPKLAAYSASKYALNGFFDSLRSQFILEEKDICVTSCILGMIDTKNARDGLVNSGSHRVLRFVQFNPADEAAKAIVTAGVKRLRVMYYPYFGTRMLMFVNSLFPRIPEFLSRELARS